MLIDERICLEPLADKHVGKHYLAWMNDRETTKYLESRGIDWDEGRLLNYISRMREERQHPFAIIDRLSGKHIGNVKLGALKPDGKTDIGIMIGDSKSRGLGFAARAYRLCLDYAFEKLGATEVFAGSYRDNKASIKLHQQLGFATTPGERADAVHFVMPKENWGNERVERLRIVGLVQVRMGSARLPGKAIVDIAGKPCLQRVCERASRSIYLDNLIIATSDASDDDVIQQIGTDLGYRVERGSAEDVFGRALHALRDYEDKDIAVRITADCPCYDSKLLDEALVAFKGDSEYIADFGHRLPDGLDVEAFTIGALRRSEAYAISPSDHEHFTQAIRRQPSIFRLQQYEPLGIDAGGIRVTLDGPHDLEVIRALFVEFGDSLTYADIESAASIDARLMEANSPHSRDEGLLRQLRQEQALLNKG